MKAPSRHLNLRTIIAAGLLTLTSCGGEDSAPQAPPPVDVETTYPRIESVASTLRSVGSIEPSESVDIRPEEPGVVREIGFEEGQTVPEGHVLLRLDTDKQLARIRQIKASLELARLNFNRSKTLLTDHTISQQEYDQVATEFETHQASLALEERVLEDMSLKAPFKGIMSKRDVSLGQYLDIGQTVSTLYAIDPVKIAFNIPEHQIRRLQEGLKLSLTVAAFPDETFEGTVYMIDPQIDPSTRNAKARAFIHNPRHRLLPGMFAQVSLITEADKSALMVPEEAVFPKGDGFALYVVKNGKASLREVSTGIRTAGKVEIIEGLSPDDEVITAGLQKIFDSAAIAPTPAASSPTTIPKLDIGPHPPNPPNDSPPIKEEH